MTIEIQNYRIVSNEQAGFDLIERKKVEQKDGKKAIRQVTLAHSISLETAIKRIIHLNLHNNPNVVSLKQYVVEYKNEGEKIKKLLELETIKK